MKVASLSLSIGLLIATTTPCFAGGWTQPKGHAQAILTGRYYTTDEYFDNSGHTQSQPDYDKYELNPYFEYGLTDAVTLGANLFLDYVKQDVGSQHSNYGLSDSELFARVRLYQDNRNVLSIQPLIKLPSTYARSGLPRSGGDQFDAELAVQGGHNFSVLDIPAFTTVSAGYRHRFEEPKDQYKIDLAIGLHATERLLVLPGLNYTGRVGSVRNPTFTQSASDDYNLLKLQLSAVYSVTDEWAVQLGGFHHLTGRNTGSGGGVELAIWKQF